MLEGKDPKNIQQYQMFTIHNIPYHGITLWTFWVNSSLYMIMSNQYRIGQDVILDFGEFCNHCGIDKQPVLIILKLIALESCKGANFCSHYFLTSCKIYIMRSLNELLRTNTNLEGLHNCFPTIFK